MSSFDERVSKWDRAARYLKIAQVLHAHGEAGISAAALARQIGVSKRTIYRDLEAMDLDAGLAIWNDGGRFGLEAGAFLPPLALTLPEAMAFFLAARLLTKATDELDPEIIGAFVKLAQVMPPVLAEQLHETADAFADTPRDEAFTRVLRTLTEALSGRRVVEIEYSAGIYDPAKGVRRLRLHPYAIEPSAETRALYVIGFDEERQGQRTFKVERIRGATLTPQTFPPRSSSVAGEMRTAWDVIGDAAAGGDRRPLRRERGAPRGRDTLASQPGGGDPARWLAALAGARRGRAGDPLLESWAGGRMRRSSSQPTCASGSPCSMPAPPRATTDTHRTRRATSPRVGPRQTRPMDPPARRPLARTARSRGRPRIATAP